MLPFSDIYDSCTFVLLLAKVALNVPIKGRAGPFSSFEYVLIAVLVLCKGILCITCFSMIIMSACVSTCNVMGVPFTSSSTVGLLE